MDHASPERGRRNVPLRSWFAAVVLGGNSGAGGAHASDLDLQIPAIDTHYSSSA